MVKRGPLDERVRSLRGKRIRAARESRGMKQCELARLVEVHPSTVCNWEAGRLTPTMEHCFKCSMVLEEDFHFLATGVRKTG